MSFHFPCPSRRLNLAPAAMALAAALASWGTHAVSATPNQSLTVLEKTAYLTSAVTNWASQPHGTLLDIHEVVGANTLLKDISAKGGYIAPTGSPLRAWRVSYVTTGPDANYVATRPGSPYVATGIILVPTTPWQPTGPDASTKAGNTYNNNRPVILFAPKTQGLGSDCAPSKALELGTEELSEVKRMAQALSKGFAVAVTDYEGYTDNGPAHQYLVGQTIGHAVLDMGLVVKQVTSTIAEGVTSASPMAIWGYSEGGLAASWAGQLLPTYAQSLVGSIKSVATGGTVADIRRAAVTLDFTLGSGMELSGVWGYHVAYPKPFTSGGPYFEPNDTFKNDVLGNEAALWNTAAPISNTPGALLHPSECVDQLGNDQGWKSILYRNTGLHGTYNGKAFNTNAFTITQVTDTPELGWTAMLNANKPGAIKITVPTYYYHGSTATSVSTAAGSYGDAKEGDILLGADSFNKYFADMCANQTPVWRQVVLSTILKLSTHESASDLAFSSVMAWTTSYLKGETPVYDPKPVFLTTTPTVMRCSDRK